MQKFLIAKREIGRGAPCFVIAEIGLGHDGSLGLAHAYVDAAADAGADAVKFQTHIADAESTRDEPFRIPFSFADASRFEYWERTAFTEEGWRSLVLHAAERGLIFLSTPFSVAAVELLERVGVPAWKIASGEVGNTILIARIASSGLPVLLSTGLSGWDEIDAAVGHLRPATPLAVLQCTTAYPAPPEQTGLNVLQELAERYNCPVGLSDHSGTIYPSLAAVTLGASVLELHLTLSRAMFGPDVPASVTPAELRQVVEGAAYISKALAAPVDKDGLAEELGPLREMFARSLALTRSLPEGTTLTKTDLTLKKPGTGLPPDRLPDLVGRSLRRDVGADELLREEDFE